MNKHLLALLCLIFAVSSNSLTAQTTSRVDSFIYISKGLENQIDQKISAIDKKLSKQSSRYLSRLSLQEEHILEQLSKHDSAAAARFLKDSKALYSRLSSKLSNVPSQSGEVLQGDYIPYLDSLQTSLVFLKNAGNVLSKTKGLQDKLGNSLSGVRQLQGRLGEAACIQDAITQRQQQLKELLSGYTNLPKHLSKSFGKYQQQAFYYGQQLRDIRESLNHPDKLISKTLGILKQVPAFQKFWNKYSIFGQLFPTPDNTAPGQAIAGLQTRFDVQQVLQQQIGTAVNGTIANNNPTQLIQQQLQQAQSEMSRLKEKLNQLGGGSGSSGDLNMPDFTPNSQKTKSFLKRLELGSNFQTQKSNNYFPVTTDVALTAGYKLNDKTTIGIGMSGRMGWGQNWKHIKITGEGIGLRLYADWKAPDLLKTGSRFMASLWFTAGAELNYTKKIEELAVFKNYTTWNKSALAGLTKKYSMRSPLKKGKITEGKVQVLYDFLHRRHVPYTPAFVWRVGWGL